MINWLRQQGFILALLLAVVLGFMLPGPAGEGGVLHAELTTKLAVALVFFVQGLSLQTRQMLAGRGPLRLHLFVLGWNFVLFPALVKMVIYPLTIFLGSALSMGFWMLAILPTTIASATALTAAARAAVPQSIFASVLSNLLAIFIVPLLVVAYLQSGGSAEISIMPVLAKLCWIVLLPLVVGQILRRCFREASIAVSERVGWLPQLAILYIVYLAFAQSVLSGVIELVLVEQLLATLLGVCLLMFVVSWAIWRSSACLSLSYSGRVAAFFTASQKSIATGLPLLSTVLAAASMPVDVAAIVLIPLLIFHPLQLLLGGMLVPRFVASPFSATSAQS